MVAREGKRERERGGIYTKRMYKSIAHLLKQIMKSHECQCVAVTVL